MIRCEYCGEPVGDFRIEEVAEDPTEILCFGCFTKNMTQIPSVHVEECEILGGGKFGG